MDGARVAVWPLVRADLALSYLQIGLLLTVPNVLAHCVEPVVGLLGDGRGRRALIRGGGVAFVVALALLALSTGFWPLLAALVLLHPASGAFVGLAQAALVDAVPHAHERSMARWVVAGYLGAVGGPLLVGTASRAGVGWRGVAVALFAVAVPIVALVWRAPVATPTAAPAGRSTATVLANGVREVWRALRRREVARLLVLLELANLMVDVLLAYLALYLVDVAGASAAQAGLAIAAWTGAGLLGSALLVPLLDRVDGARLLRVTALAALVVFPALLLTDSPPVRVVLIAALGLLTAGWYPVLQGQLYAALPGRSASVLTLGNVSGLLASPIPLVLGLVAERAGLDVAMWLLLLAPVVLLGVRR